MIHLSDAHVQHISLRQTNVSGWSQDASEMQAIRRQYTVSNDSVPNLNQQVKEVKVSGWSRTGQALSTLILS